MANITKRLSIYRTSSVPSLLRIARERSDNPNMRAKVTLSEELGIDRKRLSRMEEGTSPIPLDLAYEWCKVCGDMVAWRAIKHVYGDGLPPTDPRLIESLPNQLQNYIEQAEEGIKAAKKLLDMSADLRPGIGFNNQQLEEIETLATEIRDTDQASECVLDSLTINWGVSLEEVDRRWTQQALADHIVIPSVDQMDEIKREAVHA
ncbi:helix-turn-helix domain-containing protein [Sediminibacillus terrae]|uniref:helix-turn-helix domain-containing protein n=1 Tax=Sediminibacillus terrae TaxID=1562106 RepID=UPI00129711F6|nr:helix-turn-helix transcriptional regulator [Sediminibacillus terrae]